MGLTSQSNMCAVYSFGLNKFKISHPGCAVSNCHSCLLCGDRYSTDSQTRPRNIELSVVVSQDCNHAPTTDLILMFYRHNITHVKVLVHLCVVFSLLLCFIPSLFSLIRLMSELNHQNVTYFSWNRCDYFCWITGSSYVIRVCSCVTLERKCTGGH